MSKEYRIVKIKFKFLGQHISIWLLEHRVWLFKTGVLKTGRQEWESVLCQTDLLLWAKNVAA